MFKNIFEFIVFALAIFTMSYVLKLNSRKDESSGDLILGYDAAARILVYLFALLIIAIFVVDYAQYGFPEAYQLRLSVFAGIFMFAALLYLANEVFGKLYRLTQNGIIKQRLFRKPILTDWNEVKQIKPDLFASFRVVSDKQKIRLFLRRKAATDVARAIKSNLPYEKWISVEKIINNLS